MYFFEDDSEYAWVPKPTTRAGLDGQWVGATHGNSFFYFSVDPGEHHLCASRQTAEGQKIAAAHFTAAPGGVYCYRVKNVLGRDRPAIIKLDPLDTDEGQLLVNEYPFSTFQQKK